jgi:hypothetical protein
VHLHFQKQFTRFYNRTERQEFEGNGGQG